MKMFDVSYSMTFKLEGVTSRMTLWARGGGAWGEPRVGMSGGTSPVSVLQAYNQCPDCKPSVLAIRGPLEG